MSGPAPPKQKRRLYGAALRKLRLRRAYCVLSFLQIRRMEIRRCVSCDSPVTNRNLGGCSGRSAMSGPLWCCQCADYALQLVLVFGGNAQ